MIFFYIIFLKLNFKIKNILPRIWIIYDAKLFIMTSELCEIKNVHFKGIILYYIILNPFCYLIDNRRKYLKRLIFKIMLKKSQYFSRLLMTHYIILTLYFLHLK